MGTFTQILYQIIYSTKHREKNLEKNGRIELFKDIYGVLKNNKSHVYRINGVEDHIHIVTSVHPTVALADLVKDIKLGSSDFIKKRALFKNFNGWQEGYAAFTYSYSAKDGLIEYVINQELHHQKKTYREELIELLTEHGLAFNEKYLD